MPSSFIADSFRWSLSSSIGSAPSFLIFSMTASPRELLSLVTKVRFSRVTERPPGWLKVPLRTGTPSSRAFSPSVLALHEKRMNHEEFSTLWIHSALGMGMCLAVGQSERINKHEEMLGWSKEEGLARSISNFILQLQLTDYRFSIFFFYFPSELAAPPPYTGLDTEPDQIDRSVRKMIVTH